MNDANLKFCVSQAITTTVISTNVFDMEKIRDIGKSGNLFIHVDVPLAFSSDTETMDIDLVAATATATAGSTKVFQILGPTAASALTKGKKRVVGFPSWVLNTTYTHIGVVFTATTALATGKVSVYINMNPA